MPSTPRILTRLNAQVDELRRRSSLGDAELAKSCGVSGWTPAEHLDHLIKVSSSIVRRLLDLEAVPLPSGINPVGRLILFLGRIPRGKGKAPERLRGTKVTAAELLASLDRLRADVERLQDAHLSRKRGPVVPHPRFGGLTAAQAIDFTVLHNRHHLQIIDDILKAPAHP